MGKTPEATRTTQIVVRVPVTLRRLVEEHLKKDTHMDLSEFTRDALREKISREAPELYKSVFTNAEGDVSQ